MFPFLYAYVQFRKKSCSKDSGTYDNIILVTCNLSQSVTQCDSHECIIMSKTRNIAKRQCYLRTNSSNVVYILLRTTDTSSAPARSNRKDRKVESGKLQKHFTAVDF